MEKLALNNYKHPVIFYSLAIGISWLFWFLAAYISHLQPISKSYLLAQSIVMIIGLAAPPAVALVAIFSDYTLRNDFLNRIFNYKKIEPFYLIAACLIMFVSIVLAQTISLFFGYSAAQFSLSETTFSAGFFSGWVLLLLAPFLEELAWHSYGTDSLRSKFNLFNTCVIFTILWFFFHFPLFFIKNSYQSDLLRIGLIYTGSYLVSFFPFVVIANWLYYKTSRTVLIVVILHLTADVFAEIFNTHPMSKVIQTIILVLVAVVIVCRNYDFFFKRDYSE